MKEIPFTRRVCQELLEVNAIVFPVVASQMQPSGYPDRIVWHKYWQGWIEFKGTRTRVEPLQKVRIKELNKRKLGSAVIVRAGVSSSSASSIVWWDVKASVWKQAEFDSSVGCGGRNLVTKLAELF